MRSIRAGSNSMMRSTWAVGRAYCSSPTLTSKARTRASIAGSCRRKVEPWPAWVSICKEPRSVSNCCLTTFIPTPRPETVVTCSLSENPGWQMSSSTWDALISAIASAVTRPRSTAAAAIRSGSIPRPSSLTSMITIPRSRRADSRSVPDGDLPAASRSAGLSNPWSTALRSRCTSGSPSASNAVRSSSTSSPSMTSCASLPSALSKSRTMRGKRPNTWPTGTMRIFRTASRNWANRRSWTSRASLRGSRS